MQAVAHLTPRDVALRYGVDAHKILAWIRRGELRAINVAQHAGGKPRWRISPEALAAFEAARSAGPTPKISRVRRSRPGAVVEFF